MQSMRPSIPANVPPRATGVLGTSGDITASVATDASALDTKPDARAAPGTAAATDANSAQGSVTATTPNAVQNDALRKTAQKAGAKSQPKPKPVKVSKPKTPKKNTKQPPAPAPASGSTAPLTPAANPAAPPKQ
jgi:hypothetical protein